MRGRPPVGVEDLGHDRVGVLAYLMRFEFPQRTRCRHFRGTQTGDLQSPGGTIPASGKELNLRFMDYFKVDGGKIVDHQTIFDQMEMLGQLGALPGS